VVAITGTHSAEDPMTTIAAPETTTARRATLGMVGGALWLLLPFAWSAVRLEDHPTGSAAFVAVAASYWLFAVLPPALLVVGLTALRTALGPGRAATVGTVLSGIGLGSMALGNGIEVASMSVGGGEVALGHALFLLGFLVSVVGGIVLGIVVVRRRRDALSRAAGLILALALPLGIGLAFLGDAVSPGTDAGFWAAIAVPTGIAWVLLGASLRAEQRRVPPDFASVS
jgi:hypothetical protein